MSLPQTGHEHHERIREQIDRLPALIDMLELRPPPAETRPAFLSSYEFITGTLWPHVQVVEESVYPELERLMQNRHSMAPMRREHEELRRLIESIGLYVDRVEAGPLKAADAMSLRRLLIQSVRAREDPRRRGGRVPARPARAICRRRSRTPSSPACAHAVAA